MKEQKEGRRKEKKQAREKGIGRDRRKREKKRGKNNGFHEIKHRL